MFSVPCVFIHFKSPRRLLPVFTLCIFSFVWSECLLLLIIIVSGFVDQVEEREVNTVVQRKMDENRAEYKQLVIEAVLPPPQNVCIAAVHVENAIT